MFVRERHEPIEARGRTGRAADRQTVLDFGAQQLVDLENDALKDVGQVDLVIR